MSQPSSREWTSPSQESGTEWWAFLGHTDLSPQAEAEMWQANDRSFVEYEEFFEDEDEDEDEAS